MKYSIVNLCICTLKITNYDNYMFAQLSSSINKLHFKYPLYRSVKALLPSRVHSINEIIGSNLKYRFLARGILNLFDQKQQSNVIYVAGGGCCKFHGAPGEETSPSLQKSIKSNISVTLKRQAVVLRVHHACGRRTFRKANNDRNK